MLAGLGWLAAARGHMRGHVRRVLQRALQRGGAAASAVAGCRYGGACKPRGWRLMKGGVVHAQVGWRGPRGTLVLGSKGRARAVE